MNKPEFFDEYVSPHQDPLAPTHQDFDFEEVAQRLGEQIDDDNATMSFTVTPELVRAFTTILQFCVDIDLYNKNAPVLVGRRLIAMAWVINPGLFDGSPSITELSERMGLSGFPLKILTGEVTRQFGITNRAQAHAWNRKPALASGNGSACPGVSNTQRHSSSDKDAPKVKRGATRGT